MNGIDGCSTLPKQVVRKWRSFSSADCTSRAAAATANPRSAATPSTGPPKSRGSTGATWKRAETRCIIDGEIFPLDQHSLWEQTEPATGRAVCGSWRRWVATGTAATTAWRCRPAGWPPPAAARPAVVASPSGSVALQPTTAQLTGPSAN